MRLGKVLGSDLLTAGSFLTTARVLPSAMQFTETDGVHAVAMAAGRPLRFIRSPLPWGHGYRDSVGGQGAEGRAAAAEYLGLDVDE